MAQLLALMKYWQLFIAVVTMIEEAVPDGTAGTVKLDLAMKAILKMNEELATFTPDMLAKMFAFAKVVFTGLKAIKGEPGPA